MLNEDLLWNLCCLGDVCTNEGHLSEHVGNGKLECVLNNSWNEYSLLPCERSLSWSCLHQEPWSRPSHRPPPHGQRNIFCCWLWSYILSWHINYISAHNSLDNLLVMVGHIAVHHLVCVHLHQVKHGQGPGASQNIEEPCNVYPQKSTLDFHKPQGPQCSIFEPLMCPNVHLRTLAHNRIYL